MADSSLSEIVIERATAGDPEAMAVAFQTVRTRMKRMVEMRMDYRLWGRLDPSDVVQEAFLDANHRLQEFVAAPRMPLLLWFRALVGQRLIDLHRHHLGAQKRDARLELSLAQGEVPQTSTMWMVQHLVAQQESASATAIRVEMKERLQEVLAGMEPMDREVLALRHFESMTNKEVADCLGLTKTAASNRYLRALKRLKDAYGPVV